MSAIFYMVQDVKMMKRMHLCLDIIYRGQYALS